MDEGRRTSRTAFPLLPGGWPLLLAVVALAACEHSVVSVVEVSEIELFPTRITLVEGDRETVSVVLRENGGAELSARAVTWTVDDGDVAAITSNGVVEARAPGQTRIHASSGGVSATADVTVVAAQEADGDGDDSCHIRDRTFTDDIEIPRNWSCTFTNVRVRGDLELEVGASLVATDLRVDGDIEADGADELRLTAARVGGDVVFEKGGSVNIRDSQIGGKVELKSNHGRIDLRGNTVAGHVTLEKNRDGPFTLFRNQIDGKLDCKSNIPAPTGSGNVVTDGAGGQCRGM
jgi:hypothetical protein